MWAPATNGVVIATEKKVPSILVDEKAVQKVHYINKSIGVVYSGMGPDYRVLLRKARKRAQTYFLKYKVRAYPPPPVAALSPPCARAHAVPCYARNVARYAASFPAHRLTHPAHLSTRRAADAPYVICAQEDIPVLQLVREVADVMQEFTQSGGVRPFGVSLLVCGCDADGPQLYQVDPSGSYFGWRASAMGKNYINAKTFLEKVRRHTLHWCTSPVGRVRARAAPQRVMWLAERLADRVHAPCRFSATTRRWSWRTPSTQRC